MTKDVIILLADGISGLILQCTPFDSSSAFTILLSQSTNACTLAMSAQTRKHTCLYMLIKILENKTLMMYSAGLT